VADNYRIQKISDTGWVEFDVNAPSLETAITKFRELEAELDPLPVVDVHEGEQTLFESVGEPDPIEVNRSAETGRFVSEEFADENPSTTVTEHIER
jgi:hypothetical protein